MSHQLIIEKWAIPTSELTSPRRTGGRTTIRGFAFQDAYACLQLTRLLASRHGAFVIRLRDREEPECWYQMEEFYRRVNRPFYVLADDLFRSPDVVSALCELSPSLPITVLATSRKNEYRLPRFKGELVREDLKQPSKEEKERVLERLGKSRNELTPEQQSRLDGANQFIVLMMELTAGKELSEIVRDAVERLKEQDQSAYRAYEYLCFAYQHSVSEAVNYLRIAVEKAPEDFQPPASEEIPKLLQQCEEALNMSNAEAS